MSCSLTIAVEFSNKYLIFVRFIQCLIFNNILWAIFHISCLQYFRHCSNAFIYFIIKPILKIIITFQVLQNWLYVRNRLHKTNCSKQLFKSGLETEFLLHVHIFYNLPYQITCLLLCHATIALKLSISTCHALCLFGLAPAKGFWLVLPDPMPVAR